MNILCFLGIHKWVLKDMKWEESGYLFYEEYKWCKRCGVYKKLFIRATGIDE